MRDSLQTKMVGKTGTKRAAERCDDGDIETETNTTGDPETKSVLDRCED